VAQHLLQLLLEMFDEGLLLAQRAEQ